MSEKESQGSSEDDMSNLDVQRKKKGCRVMTQFEKNLLLELIAKYSIIESKKSDFGTVGQKQKAWDTIQSEFSSQPGVTARNVAQLKTWWNNSKKRAKKAVRRTTELMLILSLIMTINLFHSYYRWPSVSVGFVRLAVVTQFRS
jgi:Myb/SANT-like DNA-binding protein